MIIDMLWQLASPPDKWEISFDSWKWMVVVVTIYSYIICLLNIIVWLANCISSGEESKGKGKIALVLYLLNMTRLKRALPLKWEKRIYQYKKIVRIRRFQSKMFTRLYLFEWLLAYVVMYYIDREFGCYIINCLLIASRIGIKYSV